MGNVYKFFEWAGAQDGYGAYGFERWQTLHTGPGQFNWAPVDAWLQKQGAKPKAFAIATALSQLDGWEAFADCTPAWVYDGLNRPVMHGRPVGKMITATVAGVAKVAAVPYYNDQGRWWKYLQEFVLAFGARYDGAFEAVFAGPGLDIENQADKPPFSSGQDYRFGQLCDAYSDWHKEAFTKTPVFVVVSIGQGRLALAQHAAANGHGIKHNGGFVHDLDSHQGYDNFVGSWDAMQWANENGVPTWVESAYGYQDKRKYWWSIYASLAYHPVAVDIHSGLLDSMTPEQVQFIRAHTNVTAATALSAWCVLRDAEYSVVRWTGANDGNRYGCGGHPGNWEFYLHMAPDADAPRVEDVGPADAPESRQSRRVVSATFTVDEGFAPPPYKLSIRLLDEPEQGKTLRVNDGVTEQFIVHTGSGAWETVPLTIKSRSFTITGNGGVVHMVTVEPITVEPPEPPVDEPPPPVVDWAAMHARIDEAQAALDAADSNLKDAALAVEVAQVSQREAYARLAELRGMMQRAEAGL